MKYFSPNRPHPESRAEVPPTGNFSPSKNDRYYFLLPPLPLSPISPPPSAFYTLTAAAARRVRVSTGRRIPRIP